MADLDLDRLAKLVAAMTPGLWERKVWHGSEGKVWTAIGPIHSDDDGNDPDGEAFERAKADARGMQALANARDELLRLARVGQAFIAVRVWSANEPIRPAFEALEAAYRAAMEGQ